MNLETRKKIVLATVMVVAIGAAVAAAYAPKHLQNRFCPRALYEWVEYDEKGEWKSYNCERLDYKNQ